MTSSCESKASSKGVWRAVSAAAAGFIVCAAAQGENLLRNPGFENTTGNAPAHWSPFVQPMEGAYARLSADESHEGEHSAVIHNPRRYDDEPVNNWSQNIVRNLTGKELVLRGWIKSEAVTHAALWVQCSSRVPYYTLKFATTYDETPIAGTEDWTPVQTRVVVPDNTDFVTVRCVIQGEGTAWFDGLELLDAKDDSDEAEDDAQESDDKDQAVEKAEPTAKEEEKPADPSDERPMTETDTIEFLINANEALRETVNSLREVNARMADELQTNQAELRALRRELEALKTEAEDLGEAITTRDVPPLIPGGDPRRIE